jgi:holliday junction DNA helicase RuvB
MNIDKILKTEAEGAANLGQPIRHIILYGPPGLGKSTLGRKVAELQSGAFLSLTATPSWAERETLDLLMGLPTDGYTQHGRRTEDSPNPSTILIDECHGYSPKGWNSWLRPLHDAEIDHGDGQVSWLPDFTAVFCTTALSKVPNAIQSRCLKLRMSPWTRKEMNLLVHNRFPRLSEEDTADIVRKSRGVPRLAIQYAESRLRHGEGWADVFGIDEDGYTPDDRRYLEILAQSRRPVALSTLASRLGLDRDTVELTIEPYLLAAGRIAIESGGRVLCSVTEVRGPREVAPSESSDPLAKGQRKVQELTGKSRGKA